MSHHTQTFRFFDLPAELRNEICAYVLQDEQVCVKTVPSTFSRRYMRRPLCRQGVAGGFFLPHRLPILDTNQQMRLELAPLLFATKLKLTLLSYIGLRNLTRNIGTLGLERLGWLKIKMYLPDFVVLIRRKPTFPEMLKQLTGLQLVKIRVYYIGHFYPSPYKMKPEEFIRGAGVRELWAAQIKCDVGFRHRSVASMHVAQTWVDDVVSIMNRELEEQSPGLLEYSSFVKHF